MTGVVAAVGPNDHIGATGELVDDLALALVAPLTADYRHDRHTTSLNGLAVPARRW
jgi:hypothetical protein